MGLYMEYNKGEIKGDATQKGFEQWINLHSFSWGMKRLFVKDTGRAYNREGAQAQVNQIIVTKEVDSSSGSLHQTAWTEHKGKPIVIAFVRTGDPGDAYLTFTLQNAVFEKFDVAGPRDQIERPTEVMKINFTEMEINTVVLKEDNVGEQPLILGYNIATGLGH
jgi:type VI secretion system secreted protein Hcp